jgi:PAS domain S-box-containing protein
MALWNAHVQGLSDNARKRAFDQFRLVLEAAPTGMLMSDQAGKIVLVNGQVEKLFGYSRAELIAKDIEMLVPARLRARHARHRTSFHDSPQARAMGAGGDLHGTRKDGSEVLVEIGLSPLVTPEGLFVLSTILDVTERRRAELERRELLDRLKELNAGLERRVEERTAALTSTLREREVLLQEVHHRVKNNLAVIASLMDMQGRLLQPGGGRDALRDCQSRVHAIALIHEKLYQVKNFADVPFAAYIRGLASDVFHATGAPSGVSLLFAVEDVAIPLDKAVPCALVLNELVMNALKHAFPGGRRGTIRVELSRADSGHVRLAVVDDGVGLPAGLDPKHAASLGLRVVATLAEQLQAELTFESHGGASFVLTFPMDTQ